MHLDLECYLCGQTVDQSDDQIRVTAHGWMEPPASEAFLRLCQCDQRPDI